MVPGSIIVLRPACPADRQAVYEWMVQSDVTASMMGPPTYPEVPIPTWEQFCDDYVGLYFDGTHLSNGRSFVIELAGEAIGHISYSAVESVNGMMELDLWFCSERVCGRGYGSDALQTLMDHLHTTLGITEFMIRPSLRNPRAIRAYANAGFQVQQMSQEEHEARYGPGDYHDTVVMRKTVD